MYIDCSMTKSKVEYMHVSFVGFRSMIGGITVFDFGEWFPLLISFNSAACHSWPNVQLRNLKWCFEVFVRFQYDSIQTKLFQKIVCYGNALFLYRFVYFCIILRSKTNRWFYGKRSDVSNYCNQTYPIKWPMSI